jgi:hypothetical protein
MLKSRLFEILHDNKYIYAMNEYIYLFELLTNIIT